MFLRLCLRVAKIRTFAPLLVPLRCAGTIALLSDFCSAGWAAPAAFLSQGIISNTPQVMRGVRFLPHAKNRRFFPRGLRLCLRLCPTKYPRFAAVLCGDLALFPQKKNARCAPRSSFCHFVPKLSRCSLIFAPRGGQLPPHFYRKASFATPRKILRGVCFLPHAKNQRFFPRGPRLCLRLCPTKCPRFAAVLCGDPVVFPQKKCKTFAPLLVLSLYSETIALLSDFCSAGWRP